MNSLEKVFTRNENVVFRQVADELILVPIRDKVADLQCIYTLNDACAFIWSQIDGKKSLAHIIDSLVSTFSVSMTIAQDEVSTFVGQLASKKLIAEISKP